MIGTPHKHRNGAFYAHDWEPFKLYAVKGIDGQPIHATRGKPCVKEGFQSKCSRPAWGFHSLEQAKLFLPKTGIGAEVWEFNVHCISTAKKSMSRYHLGFPGLQTNGETWGWTRVFSIYDKAGRQRVKLESLSR